MNDSSNNTHGVDVKVETPINHRKLLLAFREALLLIIYAIEDALDMERSMTAATARRKIVAVIDSSCIQDDE